MLTTKITLLLKSSKFIISPEILSILNESNQADFKYIKGPVPVKNVIPFKEIFYVFLLLIFISSIVSIWRKRINPVYKKINYDILEDP